MSLIETLGFDVVLLSFLMHVDFNYRDIANFILKFLASHTFSFTSTFFKDWQMTLGMMKHSH